MPDWNERKPSRNSVEFAEGFKKAGKRMLARHLSRDGYLLGALGAVKGGYARAESLTKKERKDIAVNAAKQRWK